MTLPPGKSAFLVCGDDDFRVETAVREIIDSLVPPEEREYGLEVIDGRAETIDEMLRAMHAASEALFSDGLFGGGEKTVWFREPAFLSDGRDKESRVSKSEEVKAQVAKLCDSVKKGLPDGCRLIVSTLRINRGQTFFKTFSSAGAVFDFGSGFRESQLRDLAGQLLMEQLPKFGLEMKPAVQGAFLGRAGFNSRRLVSELEKLAAYCGDRKTVTAKDVEEIVSPGATSEIWDLTDAFAMRDVKKFMALLERHLDAGESAIGLVQMILNSVTTLLLAKDALARGWASASGRAISWDAVPEDVAESLDLSEKDIRKSLSGFKAQKTVQAAAMWKTGELRAARHHVVALREDLVSKQLPEKYMLEARFMQALRQA